MTPRVLAALARQLELAAADVFAIKAYDRREPHIFAEQKDELRARLRKMAVMVRNQSGGAVAKPRAPRSKARFPEVVELSEIERVFRK